MAKDESTASGEAAISDLELGGFEHVVWSAIHGKTSSPYFELLAEDCPVSHALLGMR